MEEPLKQGNFVVWLPVVTIKHKPYKLKKRIVKQKIVHKPNYK
jgi:hypothetical protein